VVAGLQILSLAQVIPCWAVKMAVAQYGVAVVEARARAKGISDRDRAGEAMLQVRSTDVIIG
jgi:hypothetical protein